MFCKFFLPFALVAVLSLQVQGHALITPALGVKGNGVRNDVQRPSSSKPCGNINIANNLDSATPVVAGADGSFTMNATDFNAGKDGSRQVAVKINGDATGTNFTDATVTKNGQSDPATVGSDQITGSLPAGTKCTGGKAKNLCLASVTTTAGFGNCVVIQQGGGAQAARDIIGTFVVDESTGVQGKQPVVGTRAPRYARRWAAH